MGTRRLAGALAVFAGVVWSANAAGGQSATVTVTGNDGRPVPGVALFLPTVRTPGDPPLVVVDQRGEAFVPVVTVVTVGDEVQFTNSDPTSHHVYSFSRPNAFALPLYKGDARLSTRFTHPGVVVLGCNIHDSMIGYVVVVESTRRGITGTDGRVTFANVPAGKHVVRAWAPGLDRDQPPELGSVAVGETDPASASFRIAVSGAVPPPQIRGSLIHSDY